MAAQVIACIMFCSHNILFCISYIWGCLLWVPFILHVSLPYVKNSFFVFLSVPHERLLVFLLLGLHYVWEFLLFAFDSMYCYLHWRQRSSLLASIYVICCVCLVWLLNLVLHVQVCIYIQLLYVHVAWQAIGIHVHYWSLPVHYSIVYMSPECNMQNST